MSLSKNIITSIKQLIKKKKKVEIPSELCKKGYVDDNIFNLNRLSKFYCFNPKFLIFGGPDESNNYNYPVLLIRFCNHQTEKTYNITCATEEEKIKLFSHARKPHYHIFYQNNKLSDHNYTHPVKDNYVSLTIGVDIANKKMASYSKLIFKEAFLETDSGILFPDKTNVHFTEFETVENTLELASGDFFAKIYINMSRNLVRYKRYYIKLADVLAKVGGVFSIASELIVLLYSFYLDNTFYLLLYEKLYNLQVDDNNNIKNENLMPGLLIPPKNINILDENKNLDLTKEKDQSKNKILNSPRRIFKNIKSFIEMEKNAGCKDIIQNKEIIKIHEYKTKKRIKVDVSFCERVKYYCCCYEKFILLKSQQKKLKYEIVMAADMNIQKRLEIFEVFKQLDQFRLLVKLLLNENQSFMLQNRGRQLISNEFDWTKNFTDLNKAQDYKTQKNKMNLMAYLKDKKENNLLSNIDLV